MSIIGTRPPLISETNLYELHHRARLAIKPGITGIDALIIGAIASIVLGMIHISNTFHGELFLCI